MKTTTKKLRSELKSLKEELKTTNKKKLGEEQSKNELIIQSLKNDFETLKHNLIENNYTKTDLKDNQILELRFNLENISHQHSSLLKELSLTNNLLNDTRLELSNTQEQLKISSEKRTELEAEKQSLNNQLASSIEHFGNCNFLRCAILRTQSQLSKK